MAKPKQNQEPETLVDEIKKMRIEGVEQFLFGTGRPVRLRTLEPKDLLTVGKMPDILTPLVVKSVYEELRDEDIRDFLALKREKVEDALAMLESIDLVAGMSIMDETPLSELTLGEKRWIFRLALGPAELLITFRFDPFADVESVAEEQELQPVTQ